MQKRFIMQHKKKSRSCDIRNQDYAHAVACGKGKMTVMILAKIKGGKIRM